MFHDEDYWGQDRVCSLTPTEFEEYCCKILHGYGEEEHLPHFTISHNVKLVANDGIYQIDVYATYTALGSEMRVIAECKQYKNCIKRDKVVLLADKVRALGAQKGILLSTAGFQSGAIKYAKEHGIALIQVFDTREDWYSHSGGPNTVLDEEDPMVYIERHMPIFRARLITANPNKAKTIYPTRAMVDKIYVTADDLSRKMYGISIIPTQWQREE